MSSGWVVEFFDEAVKQDLASLPLDMQAKFAHIRRLIEAFGLESVHEPYIKYLESNLWEMRLTGRDGIARAIYVAASKRRVVVVHVFVKKTEKTPRREIKAASVRAKEVR